MGTRNVVCAEMLLAKYFLDHSGAEHPVGEIVDWVKGKMRGSGVRRAEIKAARKNLGIKSQKTESGYVWVWTAEDDPETVWSVKSKELLEC